MNLRTLPHQSFPRRYRRRPLPLRLAVSILVASTIAAAASDERVAALRARVAELEETLRREEAGAATPAAAARARPRPVSTAAAAAAATAAEPGKTDKEYILRLAALSKERRATDLYPELEKNLLAGPPGWIKLYDLVDHIGDDKNTSTRFYANYTNGFSLMHLAMLHEEELARFFHFYIVASRDKPGSNLRRGFYRFAPVFLEFHAGRFPELEGAFHLDILTRLEKRDAPLEDLFGAMEALRFFPDPPVIWPLLRDATTLREWNLLFDHLRVRDDLDATGMILRFITEKGDFRLQEVRLALATLARSTVPRAEQALEDFISDPFSAGPATRAYFSVAREPRAAPLALSFLNSGESSGEKHAFLRQIGVASPALLREIDRRSEQVRDPQVLALVRDEISRLGEE